MNPGQTSGDETILVAGSELKSKTSAIRDIRRRYHQVLMLRPRGSPGPPWSRRELSGIENARIENWWRCRTERMDCAGKGIELASHLLSLGSCVLLRCNASSQKGGPEKYLGAPLQRLEGPMDLDRLPEGPSTFFKKRHRRGEGDRMEQTCNTLGNNRIFVARTMTYIGHCPNSGQMRTGRRNGIDW